VVKPAAIFQNAFLKNFPTLTSPAVPHDSPLAVDRHSFCLLLRPAGLALRALLFKEGWA